MRIDAVVRKHFGSGHFFGCRVGGGCCIVVSCEADVQITIHDLGINHGILSVNHSQSGKSSRVFLSS